MILICWVGGVIFCVNTCIAWWLWLVICERVVRLFGWLFVGCDSEGWITICEFKATVPMIWVRGVCCWLSVWLRVLFLVPGRTSCVCRARFACWSWERVASWLVGAGSEGHNSCSLWQWYWRCAYGVVVPFCDRAVKLVDGWEFLYVLFNKLLLVAVLSLILCSDGNLIWHCSGN